MEEPGTPSTKLKTNKQSFILPDPPGKQVIQPNSTKKPSTRHALRLHDAEDEWSFACALSVLGAAAGDGGGGRNFRGGVAALVDLRELGIVGELSLGLNDAGF